MLAALAPFAPAIASGIGGILSNIGGRSANSAAAELANENRQWLENMSNTAHQREVTDLRAAGLNPILSATGGMGASTPSGNVAPVQNTLGPAVSTALEAYRGANEGRKTQQQIQIDRPKEMAAAAAERALNQVTQPVNQLIDKIPDIISSAKSTALQTVDDVKGIALPDIKRKFEAFKESMTHPTKGAFDSVLDFYQDIYGIKKFTEASTSTARSAERAVREHFNPKPKYPKAGAKPPPQKPTSGGRIGNYSYRDLYRSDDPR